MKTIAEINEIAPYHPCEWQQGYGIWQSGYMEGQKNGATEQKSIDEEELAEYKRQRDEYYDELCRLRQEKVELIDKACKWRCRNCNRCIADADKISRCPGLKMLRKAME